MVNKKYALALLFILMGLFLQIYLFRRYYGTSCGNHNCTFSKLLTTQHGLENIKFVMTLRR